MNPVIIPIDCSDGKTPRSGHSNPLLMLIACGFALLLICAFIGQTSFLDQIKHTNATFVKHGFAWVIPAGLFNGALLLGSVFQLFGAGVFMIQGRDGGVLKSKILAFGFLQAIAGGLVIIALR